MYNIKKYVPTCIKSFYHKMRTFYFYVGYNLFKKNNNLPYIASIEETLQELLKNHKSIARFGDGEIKWILNLPQDSFQQQNELLQKNLIRVLTIENENCLVTLPPEMTDLSENTEYSKRFWRRFFVKEGAPILEYLDVNRKYYNTDISRCYINYNNEKRAGDRFERLKKLWDKRDILIIEGEKTRLGMGNDLFDNCHSIRRILAPAKNAYDVYEKIYDIIKLMRNEDELILLALGPTATILAYDLSREGIQAIDIGHVDIEYEWYRMRTREKVPIKGKYVNEAGEIGKKVNDQGDKIYMSQIIYQIKN